MIIGQLNARVKDLEGTVAKLQQNERYFEQFVEAQLQNAFYDTIPIPNVSSIFYLSFVFVAYILAWMSVNCAYG